MLLAPLLAFCTCVTLYTPGPPSVDHCESLVITQARDVVERLRAGGRAMLGGGAAGGCSAVYTGTLDVEGHLMRPGMTRPRAVRMEIVLDAATGAMMVQERSGPDQSPRIETTLLLQERAARQEGVGKPFRELKSSEAPGEAAQMARWWPASAAFAAASAAASCRSGEPIDAQGHRLTPVTFCDRAGGACTLLLDGSNRVVRIESLASDPRLGDVCNWTSFEDWQDHNGVAVPGRIVRFFVLPDVTLKYTLTLSSVAASTPPAAVFQPPPERRGDLPDWGSLPSVLTRVEFVALGPGLWAMELAETDSRVLVVERKADLVVLEAPYGDTACETVLAALRERFPGKPVALAAVGHHHPASSGGLRAFAGAGATVVAPRALEPYVKWILSRPNSLAPATTRPTGRSTIEFFEGERTIEAGEASVRLIDIGEHSAHAFCYVVFYFPSTGILFEGDLGYFPAEGAFSAGPRIKGLVREMDRLGVRPNRLVQAWPVRNVRREVEWREVVGALEAEAQRPQKK
ncbi:MAG TPA: hypothetical protein VEB22_00350 [Phycisphaerales bacterium]|nr:hypothetical protein [Phycisphaerales bacterium]